MKIKLITGCLLLSSVISLAQVTVTEGPKLNNDPDSKMNRMLGGDDNSFYCYRVRSKGKGTSFIIEKYDKVSLKPVFSKEVNLEDEKTTKIEDVEYSNGNVFIFRRQYDKKADKMTLFFQTVASDGKIDPAMKEITTVSADHYEFVDFDIYPNPSQTKFLIKACHKANKEDTYKTDMILLDATSMKKVWTKTIEKRLVDNSDNFWGGMMLRFFTNKQPNIGFAGIYLDNKDNVYYCYNEKVAADGDNEAGYVLKMGILNSTDNAPKVIDLPFDDKYYVKDIQFMKSNDNEIVVGGYLKDVIERKGRDLIKTGVFSFTINLKSQSVTSKPVRFFDDKLLDALESTTKNKKVKDMGYKMDYILPVGKDVYYIGEQYHRYTTGSSMGGMGGMGMGGSSRTEYHLEFMDVLVAKLNAKGEFEWIQNSPLRVTIVSSVPPPLYKQYFAYATASNVYIMCDDNAKNLEIYKEKDFTPKKLKDVSAIHGSNFVCNAISTANGSVKRSLVWKNDDYCFAPVQEKNPQFRPPTDCEIFVPGKNNEIYIYTENKGLDRFAKLKFE